MASEKTGYNLFPTYPVTGPATSQAFALSGSNSGAGISLGGTSFSARVQVSNAQNPGPLPDHLFVPPDGSFDTYTTLTAGNPPLTIPGPIRYIRLILDSGDLTGGNVVEQQDAGKGILDIASLISQQTGNTVNWTAGDHTSLPNTAGVYQIVTGAEAGQKWQVVPNTTPARRPELESLSLQALAARQGINVLDYGATGDGTTNDRPALLDAVTAAAAAATAGNNPLLIFPPNKGYAISSTLKIPKGIHLQMDAPVIYTGSANEDALTIGMSSADALAAGLTYANSTNDGMQMKLWVRRAAISDWTDEASVGLHIYNLNRSHVEIVDASNFTIGVLCHGDRWGFAYNGITLGILGQNKVALDLLSDGISSSVQGYANENTFYGGHFTGSSSLGSRSRTGIRQRWAGILYPTNNNRFFSPCFELKEASLTGGATAYAFEQIDAQSTRSYSARHEGGVAALTARYIHAKESGQAGNNRYDITYADRGCIIDDSAATARTSRLEQLGIFSFLNTNAYVPIWTSGRIVDYASTANSLVGFAGTLHTVDSSGNISNQGAVASYTVTSPYVTSAGFVALGVYVRSSNVKRFMVRKDLLPGYASNGTPAIGRIYIKPFDSAGTALTGGGATTYVTGEAAGSFLWGTAWGGAYALQSDGYSPNVTFAVSAEVDSFQVMVGLNKTQLIGFQLLASENLGVTVWSGVTAPTSSAAPTPERIWDSGYLGRLTAAYDATKYHIQTMSAFDYTTGNVALAGLGATVFADHIEIGNAGSALFGVWMDTSTAKKFIVNRTVLNSRGGRLRIACFDTAGARLTGGTDLTATTAMTYSGTTNTYSETVDNTGATNTITVGSSVTKVYVMIQGGSNPVQLVSWNMDIYGASSRVWTGAEGLTADIDANYGTQAPVNGTYLAGKRVLNIAPAAAGKIGYVCVTAGTPGTWKPYGPIDA